MDRDDEHLIPRRATRQDPGGPAETRWLSEWCDLDAYVLLGDPGSGKSTAFRQEAEADPDGAHYIPARDFVDLSVEPAHRHKTLFIDALDEMRAGSSSAGGPLGDIRRALNQLARPRFRLSCREADWLSADQASLQAVAPHNEVAVLRLEPLRPDEIRTLLQAWPNRVPDPQQFLDRAERQQMSAMLGNPLLLNLIVDASRGGELGLATRDETYRLACEHLASEHNESHRRVRRQTRSDNVPELLADAGRLCAVLLLANKAGFIDGIATESGDGVRVDLLPRELNVQHPHVVLASKLFSAEGSFRSPRHRTLAEYLAARTLAQCVEEGLPIGRALALMSGLDGGIVEPLRGLHAWLALHCPAERALLIDRDPLGVVLYGDVRSFSASDKRQVLDALHREAQRFQWFRSGHWESHPFGALGTRDMIEVFRELLQSEDRSAAHQSLLGCVLDAVQYGQPMPELKQVLEAVLRDSSCRSDVRVSALQAWFVQPEQDWRQARRWLDETWLNASNFSEEQLLGELLRLLYPDHLSATEVMGYRRTPNNSYGAYLRFWRSDLIDHTLPEGWSDLADAVAKQLADEPVTGLDFSWQGTVSQVLNRALCNAGAGQPVERLYAWLGIGLDEYGNQRLNGTDMKAVRDWLNAHPDVQRAVFAHGLNAISKDSDQQRRDVWRIESHLHGAIKPSDWYRWLLTLVSGYDIEEVVRYALTQAAYQAINPSADFEITMEDVEAWLESQARQWPQAREWLESIWWCSLDDWRGEEKKRQLEYDAKDEKNKKERRSHIQEFLPEIGSGKAPLQLMHHIAGAYLDLYLDVRGDTPEKRIKNFLVGSTDEVRAALQGLKACLQRQDLPTVDEILKLELDGRYHLIRPACLVGADLVEQEDAAAPATWGDDLARRLVAFRLSDGTGKTPRWYTALSQQRPQLVAEIFIRHVKGHLRHRKEHIFGLSVLLDDEHAAVTGLVLPELLRSIPVRANAAQLRMLNDTLLVATARRLDLVAQQKIADDRLAKSLDAGQRIAWLAFALRFDPERRGHELVEFVGSSQSRAAHLGVALESQGGGRFSPPQLPIEPLARVVELLAPHASPERPLGGVHEVSDSDRRRDLVNQFLRQLGASPEPAARLEMLRLRALPTMKHWYVGLDAALYEQARIARAASFRHASIEQVALTLANVAPANVQDLSALVVDHLRYIGNHLRHDNTNSLRLFWEKNADENQVPRSENDCRDVLLDKLADRLVRLAVQLEKEAQFANDKRADLKAIVMQAGRRLVLPVEIKKENHAKLWTAWHDQLDGQYTTDPDAQGVGIYLVLWFNHQPRPAPEGARPTSAAHLEQLLRARIPPDDQRRLSVVVLDLSLPGMETVQSRSIGRPVDKSAKKRPKPL